ncbi:MAG: hypothetical protein JSR58_00525 [Verrucomicrobia bacterium]|nr:hypothetical protein [Verrucomicrobiota bacterium]
MLRENLRDASQIIQNILTQPLSIPGINRDISLLEAAQSFNAKDPSTSHLKRVIETFHEYREATETMLRELELLADDLKT